MRLRVFRSVPRAPLTRFWKEELAALRPRARTHTHNVLARQTFSVPPVVCLVLPCTCSWKEQLAVCLLACVCALVI